MVRLQIRRRVRDQREARGVRLGEAVERERRDAAHDVVLHGAGDAARAHAGAKPALDRRHALLRALEAHRATELLGLAAGEARGDHRDTQQLLLEERHAERAREDRLERRMRIGDRRSSGATREIRMHHLSDDRTGPDDRDLDDEVVEMVGLHARERRHLRPALDLKDADRVGALEHRVDLRIVGRQMREVELDAVVRAHERDRLLERLHHAEAEQIDLDEPEIRTVVLVPLDHVTAGHRRRLERHDVVEPAGGDHHAAGVLSEMARQTLDAPYERDQQRDARRVRIDAAVPELCGELVVLVVPAVRAEQLREPIDLVEPEAERLPDLADGATRAVADDGRRHGGAARAVATIDVLDDLLATVAGRQVEIDVGPLAALLGEEALEEEVHRDGVDRRDAEGVADRAVRRRAATLTEDAALAAEADDVPDDEKVAREVELRDDGELVLELATYPLGHRPPALAGTLESEMP
jgi:hypothetical protein